MRALTMQKTRWSAATLLGAGFLMMQGCATTGSLMEAYGNATGQKSLAAAGTSFKRSAETQEFSEDEKYYTGRTVGANLLASEAPSDDAALESYVGKVGQTLALASGKATLPHGWHFMLLKEAEPDAFACPGGLIFISEGLVKLCQSEDELAGVLAHEISHVAIDHPMQAISASNRSAAFVSLAQFAYEKSSNGSAASGLADQFNNVVKDVATGVTHGYDKGKEMDADASAVKMCIETGYDPRGLKRVLLRLKKGDSTHGDPAQRAKDVEDLAYQSEPVPKALDGRTARFKRALGRD